VAYRADSSSVSALEALYRPSPARQRPEDPDGSHLVASRSRTSYPRAFMTEHVPPLGVVCY
jgi:hypothetical protein